MEDLKIKGWLALLIALIWVLFALTELQDHENLKFKNRKYENVIEIWW